MQDKEFDDLFRSKLESLEMEPSKGLWDNIAAEVIMDRPNRSALTYISIAATILVLIGAGLFFIPKVKQNTSGAVQHDVVKVKAQPKQITESQPQLKANEQKQQIAQVARVAHPVKQSIKQEQKINITRSLPAVKVEEVVAQQEKAIVAQNNEPLLAAVTPGTDIETSADTKLTDNIDMSVKPTALVQTAQPTKTVAAVRPRKRIRSFGDLINVVVNKVDKRKDKLIEFTNTDEDDSMITGVNLGIVRIKKEEAIAKNK